MYHLKQLKMERKLNIIFIIVDALRARNMGCYGYCKPTTPNIDNLARRGIFFKDSYSCTNATDPSLTTIFSGRHPISHGIVHHGGSWVEEEIQKYYMNMVEPLPQILRSMGYTTMAVDWIGRWHRRGYDYYVGREKEHGYDHLNLLKFYTWRFLLRFPKKFHLYIKRFWKSFGLSWPKDAGHVTDMAIDLIRGKRKEFFFLFLHYWDPHAPYDPPKKYTELFLKGAKEKKLDVVLDKIKDPQFRRITERIHTPMGVEYVEEIEARYDGTIRFVDDEIGRLIQALERWGILEECIVLLTADHGESITEHGIYFDHHGLYDETIKVPLILLYPGMLNGKKIEGFVQHIDIVPTILDLLGVQLHGYPFDGVSLLPLIDGKVKVLHSTVYATEAFAKWRVAVRTKDYKYIYSPSRKDALCRHCDIVHTDVEELYDLHKDREENRNIHKKEQSVSERMNQQLLTWINKIDIRRKEMKKKKINSKKEYERYGDEEEIRRRLEQLGYL